jgi:cyclopropane-fatty-acyl-phospholipid synthase
MDSGNKQHISETTADSSVTEEMNSDALLRRSKSPLFHSRVTRFDRWLARTMMDVVGNPKGTLRLWDGVDVTPPVDDPVAVILYANRLAMWKTIINPELNWGDLYCNGQLEFDGDLARFLEIIYRNLHSNRKGNLLRRLIIWLGHRRIANSHARAEENIHHHYDIGNDFYKLWLDTREMQYTCAYFSDPGMNLEEAQVAKLHHVCRKLQLKPGDTVVEAGCGWGGLARFMARHYGVNDNVHKLKGCQTGLNTFSMIIATSVVSTMCSFLSV